LPNKSTGGKDERLMINDLSLSLSVHTREIIITATSKSIDYELAAVIPVIVDRPPADRNAPRPT